MSFRRYGPLWIPDDAVPLSPTVRIVRGIRATHAAFTPVVNAFRFYADGTESGSSPLAAQDTNITVNVTSGDVIVHLRVRIDETGGADGATTDDWQLQASKNSGAFSTFPSGIGTATGSQLTNNGATTNRATNGISDPGSGSFVAGIQEEADSIVSNHQLTLGNFTEHVFAVILSSTANNDADTFDFRITLNGGTPGMTNNVTPRITIQKSGPPPMWLYRWELHPEFLRHRRQSRVLTERLRQWFEMPQPPPPPVAVKAVRTTVHPAHLRVRHRLAPAELDHPARSIVLLIQEQVSQTAVGVYEALGGLSPTAVSSHEAVQSLTVTMQGNYESLAQATQTLNAVYESLQGIAADVVVNYESTGIISVTVVPSHESVQGLTMIVVGHHESLQGILQTVVGIHESLLGLAPAAVGIHEAIGSLSVTTVVSHEAVQGGIRATVIAHHESLASAEQAVGTIYEALQGFAVTVDGHHEATGTLALSAVVIHESLQTVTTTVTGRYEDLQGVLGQVIAVQEALQGVAETVASVHEATGSLTATVVVSHEVVQGLTVTSVQVYESLASIVQTVVALQEALQRIAASEDVPHESQAPISVEQTVVVHFEAGGRLSVTTAPRYESIQLLTVTVVGSHESGVSTAQSLIAIFEALGGVLETVDVSHEAEGTPIVTGVVVVPFEAVLRADLIVQLRQAGVLSYPTVETATISEGPTIVEPQLDDTTIDSPEVE